MIVRAEGDRYELYAQDAHAKQAAEIAAAFGGRDYYEFPQRDKIVKAISLHDRGWVVEDKAPRVSQSPGPPRDFMNTPANVATAIWHRSVDAAEAGVGALGAYMVSEHFARLGRAAVSHGRKPDHEIEALREFIDEQRQWQADWRASVTASDLDLSVALDPAVALLQACDALSLFLLTKAEAASERVSAPYPLGRSGQNVTFLFQWPAPRTMSMSPWPFVADGFESTIECVSLEKRDFADDAELRSAVGEAERFAATYRIVRR